MKMLKYSLPFLFSLLTLISLCTAQTPTTTTPSFLNVTEDGFCIEFGWLSPTGTITDLIAKFKEKSTNTFTTFCRGTQFNGLCCVNGLEKYHTYEVYAQTQNANGWGPRSTYVEVCLGSCIPPGIPATLQFGEITTTTILVIIPYGVEDATHTVYMSTGHSEMYNAVCVLANIGQTPSGCLVSNLIPGTKYRVYHSVSTVFGTSSTFDSPGVSAVYTKDHPNALCGDNSVELNNTITDILEQHDTLVVDGNANYYIRHDPYCDKGSACTRSVPANMSSITHKTYIAITSISVSSLLSLTTQVSLLQQPHRNAVVIRDLNDFDTVSNEGRFGVIMYSQSKFPLHGTLNYKANIADMFNKGLRIFSVSYSECCTTSTSLDERVGYGDGAIDHPDYGITDLGTLVLQELNEKRMIIDVSHSSRYTVLQAADISIQPIIANHLNARNVSFSNNRNAYDNEIKAIADTGGVIGIMPLDRFLSDAATANIDDFLLHIDYVRQLTGIDHVGVSTDAYIDGQPSAQSGLDDSGLYLSSSKRWSYVACRLRSPPYSYSGNDVRKVLGGNFLRVYKDVFSGLTKEESMAKLYKTCTCKRRGYRRL
eukprot:m.4476 g.4476  ORF g.4476 m.4476 type:complete len:595 (+) comp2997_c0_seq1:158-1942(+)